ncbi:MAG: 50S ribosomal protein L6 [Bacilli bacterium]|nr:50S ribosomal protein L6 [Bacilli bacterium]
MSRIGLKPVVLPAGVTVTSNDGVVTVKGAKGELSVKLPANVSVEVEDGTLHVRRASEEQHNVMMHGTARANIANAVKGVSEGFKKELEMNGTGYHASMKGTSLVLAVGYSHEVVIEPKEGVKISCTDETHIAVEGCDKQKVGQTAALIRDVRRPEPYKGKGIKYKGEVIIRKEGKRASGGKK